MIDWIGIGILYGGFGIALGVGLFFYLREDGRFSDRDKAVITTLAMLVWPFFVAVAVFGSIRAWFDD